MVSPSYFPAIAAVELGYFSEEGLETTIELLFPVTKTYEALRDGQLDFVGGAAHAPLYAFRDWTGCKLLCALSQNMYWFLVVRSDLGMARGDLRALKGLRIGAAPGPADGLRRMLIDAGIDPERELTIAPVPATAGVSFVLAAARALEKGAVDGFWAERRAALHFSCPGDCAKDNRRKARRGRRRDPRRGTRAARAERRSLACRHRREKTFPRGRARSHPRSRSTRRAVLRCGDFQGNGRLPQCFFTGDRAAVRRSGLRTGRRDAVSIAMEVILCRSKRFRKTI